MEGTTKANGQKEGLEQRCATLLQENVVLKSEVEVLKLRCRSLQEENKTLRQASVTIQARAEQEEEAISNKLMKKIQTLRQEKEKLAINYEQEEEFLTNDLSRKLEQLRQEKEELEHTLEHEQEFQVQQLVKRLRRLEQETEGKQETLDQLRQEKVDLENTLEQEQELLVNRLWKRMDKLESEKRVLEVKLQQCTPPASPLSESHSGSITVSGSSSTDSLQQHLARSGSREKIVPDEVSVLTARINRLQAEVKRLTQRLKEAHESHKQRMLEMAAEERSMREENASLQRRLLREMERSSALSRQLSESESSIEMEEERHFNEMVQSGSLDSCGRASTSPAFTSPRTVKGRRVSSPPRRAGSTHRSSSPQHVLSPALRSRSQSAGAASNVRVTDKRQYH